MIEIKLPEVVWGGAQDGVEALLDKWLVAEGVQVEKGQVLASVMLVKAAIVIEAPASGALQSIFVKEGENFAAGKGQFPKILNIKKSHTCGHGPTVCRQIRLLYRTVGRPPSCKCRWLSQTKSQSTPSPIKPAQS